MKRILPVVLFITVCISIYADIIEPRICNVQSNVPTLVAEDSCCLDIRISSYGDYGDVTIKKYDKIFG